VEAEALKEVEAIKAEEASKEEEAEASKVEDTNQEINTINIIILHNRSNITMDHLHPFIRTRAMLLPVIIHQPDRIHIRATTDSQGMLPQLKI
jgi:hypothetical protein